MGTSFWPIFLILLSNIFYHITTKSTPSGANPFLSLTVTYIISALISIVLYRVTAPAKTTLSQNLSLLNWTSLALAVVIIGLEIGHILLYRAAWNISVASLITNILLAASLILIGWLFYHEKISSQQIIGVLICLVGLFFINQK
jgi:drug/metabolite transporter (DMT)-like permease